MRLGAVAVASNVTCTWHLPVCLPRSYVKAEADYTPVGWKVAFKKKLTAAKVAMAAGLLGCLGQDRPAHRYVKKSGFWGNTWA